MIPGEVLPQDGEIELNAGRKSFTLQVANTGDRPIQVGSHYHFAETNTALRFDRAKARGCRLDIAAGTAIRFEPGQTREVALIPFSGSRKVYGFNAKVMGALDSAAEAGKEPAAKLAAKKPAAKKPAAKKPATKKKARR